MENETPGMDEQPTGMDRRQLIKRGAVVGGALVWTTPIVQSIAQPAFATGSEGDIDEICEDGPYSFKDNKGTGPDTGRGGDCIASTAPDKPGVAVVRYDGTKATITLDPGFRLTKVNTKSGNQTDSGNLPSGNPSNDGACTEPTLDPVPIRGNCDTGFVYEVSSTGDAADKDISHVSGELECC